MLSFIKKLYSNFRELATCVQITVILSFILGTVLRLATMQGLGYYFDMVETQYTWATNAVDMGFFSFWKNYNGPYDYMPGSLLLLMGVELVGRVFGGGEYSFVYTLKSFNWLAETVLVFALIYFAGRQNINRNRIYIFASIVYVLPSLWFVSNIWGQMDSFIVLLMLISVMLMFWNKNNHGGRLFFWSGLIIGISFIIKLQTFLLFPVLLAFHLSLRNKQLFTSQLYGFLLPVVTTLTLCTAINWYRTGVVVFAPVWRENTITNGAASLWPLLGMNGKGSDYFFNNVHFPLSVSLAGLFLYMLLMVVFYLKIRHISFRTLFTASTNIKRLFFTIFPSNMTLQQFTFLMIMNSGLYYMLFTKMHSRYLHIAIIFSLFSLFIIKKVRFMYELMIPVLVIQFSYFINQMDVFKGGSNDPAWPGSFILNANFDTLAFASLINLLCLLWLYRLYIFIENKVDGDNLIHTSSVSGSA